MLFYQIKVNLENNLIIRMNNSMIKINLVLQCFVLINPIHNRNSNKCLD